MNFSKIETIEQYDNAMNRLIEIFHAEPNTPEDQEIKKLQKLISEYESQNKETENKEDIMEFEITAHLYDLYKDNIGLMLDPEDSSFEQDYLLEIKQNTEYRKLNRSFEREYKNYLENKKYFYGCPINFYSTTYTERLEQYLIDNKDEYSFIESELKKGIEYNPFSNFLNADNKAKIETALRQRKKFLIEKLKEIGYSINFSNLKERFESFEINELKENINNKPKFEKYCEVGALFAQNLIQTKTKNNLVFYYFKDRYFESANKLSTYLKEDILKTKTAIKNYVTDTLRGTDTRKNFYLHLDMMEKIIKYCKYKKIEISIEFQTKCNSLKHLH